MSDLFKEPLITDEFKVDRLASKGIFQQMAEDDDENEDVISDDTVVMDKLNQIHALLAAQSEKQNRIADGVNYIGKMITDFMNSAMPVMARMSSGGGLMALLKGSKTDG
jgi:hypothetical protein